MENDWVDLSTAIEVLREQLAAAREGAKAADVHFSVEKAEIEFGIEARREAGLQGGVRFGVVTLEGKAGGSSASTHRIKLDLAPKGEDGGSLTISGKVEMPPPQ